MKRRILLALSIMVLACGMIGCGSAKEKKNEKITTESPVTKESVEGDTEAVNEVETETQAPAFDPTGYEVFNNVYYKLLDGYWVFNKDTNGTLLYTNSDSSESIGLYVQNETEYTKDDMMNAYQQVIVQTYGENYTTEDITAAGLDFKVYHFGSDNLLDSTLNADIYVYSDGATTIYLENAYRNGETNTGKALELLNTIVIQ